MLGLLGSQRCRQDDHGADDDHPHPPDLRHGPGRRPRRPDRARRRAPQHGAHRAGGDRGRAAHRPGEPPPDRQPLRPRHRLHRTRQRRAARAVLARGRRRPHRQDLLRRDAATARPRGEPDRDAAGAVPRRADHGPRPALARGAVGGAARARGRRHDPAADDAVPRGGRPARRQHRRDRPRHGHRRGHAVAAQGPVRCGRARRHRLPGAGPRRGPGPAGTARARDARRPGRPPDHRPRRGPGPHDPRRRHLRRQRHRPRRHRAEAAQPRRRVPPPHRSPRWRSATTQPRPTTDQTTPTRAGRPSDEDPRAPRDPADQPARPSPGPSPAATSCTSGGCPRCCSTSPSSR